MSIPYLDLTITNEEKIAAEAISRISGGLTRPIIEAQIEERRELLALIDAGLDAPICPELTNANPSAPHTVILEAMAWVTAQLAYRFNQIPIQNHIAFANLFGIEPRAATAATVTLRFTIVAPTGGTVVNIPAGTDVSTVDGAFVFSTIENASRTGSGTLDVLARRTVSGRTLLAPNVLTKFIDLPSYATAVTNPAAVDSGTETESLTSTLERTTRFQRRGLRLVTAKDLEEAIYDEGLLGNGIVRVFPFIENGDYTGERKAGYTTVVVMTRTGTVIDAATRSRLNILLDQVIGNEFVYLADPEFVDFDIAAKIRLSSGAIESTTIAAAEANLRNFYAASREQFGRGIYRSEIVGILEGTAGVERVVLQDNGAFLEAPVNDTEIAAHELARIVDIDLTVV